MEWWVHQEAYLAQWKDESQAKWWTVELIKKLWNILWDMGGHQNEALHNSPMYCNDILDSQVNDKCKLCSVMGSMQFHAMHLFHGPPPQWPPPAIQALQGAMGGIHTGSNATKTSWTWSISLWTTRYVMVAWTRWAALQCTLKLTQMHENYSTWLSIHKTQYVSVADSKTESGPKSWPSCSTPWCNPHGSETMINPLG